MKDGRINLGEDEEKRIRERERIKGKLVNERQDRWIGSSTKEE